MQTALWAPESGMSPANHAAERPNAIALYSRRGNVTFGALDRRANQFASLLAKAGLGAGDSVALVCPNTPEFVECLLGCLRSGVRLTPVSWRLSPEDVRYIVEHCDAKALVVHVDCAQGLDASMFSQVGVRLSVGGPLSGFDDYAEALRAQAGDPPPSPQHGSLMLYTSGTTGRPKGVRKERPNIYQRQPAGQMCERHVDDVHLLCGPAYHSAPIYHDVIVPMVCGNPVVMMERFDAAEALRLIETHRVTNTHMVPTMFQKLLQLPEAARRRDLTSLREVSHGGAPTSIATKRAMIEWFGPILREYYAATEGGGRFSITSAEWLRKPGSVGRVLAQGGARVLDEAGRDCAPGVSGLVHFRNGALGPRVSYHRASSAQNMLDGDLFTLGDMGHVDEDGYLFLTGRTADRIISGGVNIQPQEIDDVLASHPSVLAACCVGVPNEEWGEEIKALVVSHIDPAGREALAQALIELCRARLARYKAPRSVEFVVELPITETGKVRRGELRARYWAGREKTI